MSADGKVIIEIDGDSKDLREELEQMQDTAKTAAKGAAAAIAGIAAAMTGTALAVTSKADEMRQAMNGFAAETGTSRAELSRYQDVLESIYANNYGESFDDIAQSMGQVTRQLGEMDDDKLQALTEDAITLRDTFDYEVNETVRASKAMMDSFGISGEQAMNLIAAGAQNGLDYSDELIDSIKEYSVQFAKMGLTADDMFRIFQKGTDSGAWNLDKVGDAIKEMSIRVVDGSDTTIEGFTLIGLNADEMAKKFAAGGETARDAFQQTMQALAQMNDPLAQNTAGVDLLGTMWEDLGAEVVGQLGGITDEAYASADALKEIQSIKYDDLGSVLEGLKRSAELAIVPLGEALIPTFAKAAQNAGDSVTQMAKSLSSSRMKNAARSLTDTLGGVIDGLSDFAGEVVPLAGEGVILLAEHMDTVTKAAGIAATAFVAFKTAAAVGNLWTGWTTAVQGATTAIAAYTAAQTAGTAATAAGTTALTLKNVAVGALTGQIGLATAAQYAWNTAMTLCPVGMIAAGIAALAAGTVALGLALRETQTDTIAFYDSLDEVQSKTDELKSAQDELAEARAQNVDQVSAEYGAVQSYVEELQGYLDADGKVIEGHELRAKYLSDEINRLIPGAIDARKDESGTYYDLADSIDEVILAKQREALLEATKDEYTAAIENQTEAYQNYVEALQIAREKQNELNDLMARAEELKQTVQTAGKAGDLATQTQAGLEFEQVRQQMELVQGQLDEANARVAEAKGVWQDYQDTIVTVTGITTATTQEQLDALAASLGSGTKDAIASGADATYQQIASIQIAYEQAVREFAENSASMTDAQRDAAKRNIDALASELSAGVTQAQQAGIDVGEATAAGVLQGKESFSDAVMQLVQAGREKLDGEATDTSQYGGYFVDGIVGEIQARGGDLQAAAAALGQLGLTGLADALQTHSPSRATAEIGGYFVQGFTDEVSNRVAPARAIVMAFGLNMATALRQTQPQMVSASQYLCEGLIVGMQERTPAVLSTARSLANQVASTIQDALEIHSPSHLTIWMGEMFMIGFAYGMERKMSYVRRTARKVGDLLGEEAERIEEQIADIERQAEEREQAKALEEHKQALAEKYEELGKAEASEREKIREEIAELEADWDEKQLKEAEQAQKEALNARLDALEEFREEYEDALAEIEDAQTGMTDKLSDYGTLFARTKDGDKERFELGDLAKQRDEIIAYGEALDELKARGTPADLMAEIVQGMSIEDGTDYMRELIQMTDEELTAYLDEWTAYQQAARDIAAQYYSDQLSALETEFTARMGEELADVPEQGEQIGVDTVDGMIAGMVSREGPLAAAAAAIVRTALDAMRAAADINSPSKVAEKEIGQYIPQGVQVGMERAMPDLLRAAEDEMRRLSTQMRAAVDYETGMRPLQIASSGTALGVSDAQLAQLARMIGAVLTPVVSAGEREIKMYLNGTEVARALIPDIRRVEDQSPRIESD